MQRICLKEGVWRSDLEAAVDRDLLNRKPLHHRSCGQDSQPQKLMKRKATAHENTRNIRREIRDGSSNNNDNQFILSLQTNFQQPQARAQSNFANPVPIEGVVPPTPTGMVGSTLNHGLATNALTVQLLLQGLQPPATQPPQNDPRNQVLQALLQQMLASSSATTNPASNVLAPSIVSAPIVTPAAQWPVQPHVGAFMTHAAIPNGSINGGDPTMAALQSISQLLQPLVSPQVPPASGPTSSSAALQSVSQLLQPLVSSQVPPALGPTSSSALLPSLVIPQTTPTAEDRYMSMVNRDMSLTNDTFYLPKYQAYLRSHLEFFATDVSDANTTIQGRKRKIRPGQVGIRCRHCSDIPMLLRGKGAVYVSFCVSIPSSPHCFGVDIIRNVWPASLNMGNYHLLGSCLSINAEDRATLENERKRKLSGCGGKTYWLETCKQVGLEERDDAIWFRALERP